MNEDVFYIQYIGKKAVAYDALYGTMTRFDGPGDIKPVSREAAVKMLNHSDAYRRVTPKAYADHVASLGDDALDAEHEIELQRARERIAGEKTGQAETGDHKPPTGERPELPKPPSQLTKADCVKYAAGLGFEIDPGQFTAEELRAIAVNLRDTGNPQGVVEPPEAQGDEGDEGDEGDDAPLTGEA